MFESLTEFVQPSSEKDVEGVVECLGGIGVRFESGRQQHALVVGENIAG